MRCSANRGRFAYSKNLPPKGSREDFASEAAATIYGFGEELVELVVVVVVLVSGDELVEVVVSELLELDVEASDGSFSFTTVVLLSVFSAGGLLTVVSFCSHAASSAAPVKMQMNVFIERI